MPSSYHWKTAAVYKEAADTVTVVFDTNRQPIHYLAGQYINITLLINNEPVTRAYSLSSAPDKDEKPAITVKRVADGIMSNYIVSHAEEISDWRAEGPHGHFFASSECRQPIVLIAGGSGITPLYSMLKYYLKTSDAKIMLIYASRNPEESIFMKALNYMEQVYSQRLSIWHCFSKRNRETIPGCKYFLDSRISPLVLKKLIRMHEQEDMRKADYFLCGPAGLILLAEESLAALGIPPSRVRREYFQPPALRTTAINLPSTPQEVLFHFYEQTNLLEVNPGNTILEAALKERIPVPYSCKTGTCGICIGKLLSGSVHMKQNYSLKEEDVNNGYILLCQSHPLGGEISIDAGALS
ncbi:flavin reductase family protein [Flavihumibacter stibioxidans]|uniref:Ring-1,2-phenylacetyl-CoA epoxidase subunit PaaE n=1 Tax=Flavihumibacter stibioxidans TaxID=1834163 RepID=A0ABR7MCP6_9BACT|nr:iron-sulfur cluster-binding domain-containing protein [Flavihumibacter stibioxidans]MBC6492799.1 hypothetical protein [Flavihumibacter stibioxidans]